MIKKACFRTKSATKFSPMPYNRDRLHEKNEIMSVKAQWMKEQFEETVSAFNLVHPSSNDNDSICTDDMNMLDDILSDHSKFMRMMLYVLFMI